MRELEQKLIVKFYLIKGTKKDATRTNKATKSILSNCLHGAKTSLTGIMSNTCKSVTLSKSQFQEVGNIYLSNNSYSLQNKNFKCNNERNY